MKRDKSLEAEAKFKPNSFHPNKFNKDIKVYGEDVELKEVHLIIFRKHQDKQSTTFSIMRQNGEEPAQTSKVYTVICSHSLIIWRIRLER